jgi:hypothetical protein
MNKEIKKGNLNYDQSGRAYPDNPEVKENWDCIWEKDGKHYKLVGDNEHKEWEEVHTPKEIINKMNNIDKLIERGAELTRKHEEMRDEILNNPDMPQELKDIIIESRIPDDKIVDLTGGKRIKYINPDTFEIEYE